MEFFMKEYKHFISLGYFCSIAMELDRIGLRDCLSPFDWIISDFKGVEKAITTNFSDFLNINNIYQNKREREYYKDVYYNFQFYHDFSKYEPLKDQLESVKLKYKRRIDRFYKNIQEPTLFLRYISSENGKEELTYIENNYKQILDMLKTYNKDNDLIFISNSNIKSNKLKIFYVEPDDNDVVARKPFLKNKMLYNYLNEFLYSNKRDNLKRYNKKQRWSVFSKVLKKLKNTFNKILKKEYIHEKQYE